MRISGAAYDYRYKLGQRAGQRRRTADLSHPAATLRRMNQHDAAVLRFADQHWTHAGAREAAIWEQFGESPVRFYARVHTLLEQPDAHAAMPQVVTRLRRLRDARRAARSVRRGQ